MALSATFMASSVRQRELLRGLEGDPVVSPGDVSPSESRPTFGIAIPKWIWFADTAEWANNDQGTRPAHVYVFCLHKPMPATNANVADPAVWEFWVVSARTLDERLRTQKSIGCASLDRLAERIGWGEIKATVDHLIN